MQYAVTALARRGLIVKLADSGQGVRYHVNHYFAYGQDVLDPAPDPRQIPLNLLPNSYRTVTLDTTPASVPTPPPYGPYGGGDQTEASTAIVRPYDSCTQLPWGGGDRTEGEPRRRT